MLDESGGVVTRTQDFEPGGQVFSRGEWLTIIRVNKSNGTVSSVTTPNYSFLGYSGTMKVTPDRITDYKAPWQKRLPSPVRPLSVRLLSTIREKVSGK